jgi:hypothetical protein
MQGYAKLLLTKSSKRLYSSKERCITNWVRRTSRETSRIWITNFLVLVNTKIGAIIHALSVQDFLLTSFAGQLLLYFVVRSSLRKILQPGPHRRIPQSSRLHTSSAKPENQQAPQEAVNEN